MPIPPSSETTTPGSGTNVMLALLQKMEVNAEKFVDSLGPVSELV